MNDVLIGISTYNEIENLPKLIDHIGNDLPAADILVVDDDSPDGTGQWSYERALSHDNFYCLQRTGKLGLGTATIATMRYAIDHGYRLVINMDADLSHPASHLPELIAAVRDYDVAIGSRYTKGGRVIGWPLHRKIMSRCVNGFARLALRLPTRDCSGSYRCYRVSKLKEISLDRVRSKGYSFFEEILWHLQHANARFIEVPITFQNREQGHSKINMREGLAALRIIASLPFQTP